MVVLVFSVVTIRYRITKCHLVISWLGIPVRWMRLKNIKQITVQRIFWAEKWFNSLSPGNRYLLIEKNFGLLFKNMAITPKNHMVFKAELERARRLLDNVTVSAAMEESMNPVPEAPASSPLVR